jgi:hypothetical protein
MEPCPCGEDAGAFHDDVDAEIAPGQLLRIALGGDLERAPPTIDGVAVNLTVLPGSGRARVVAHQVGVGFDRAEIVDRHDLSMSVRPDS